MKAILISIKPKWCAKIMNGDKTIEVRKGTALYKAIQKLIDEYGFAEFYVYCTKDEKQGLVWDNNGKGLVNSKLFPYSKGSPEHKRLINGKVIFKFRCYKVEELFIKYGVGWQTKTIKGKEQVEKLTQLSVFQLFEYCGRKTNTAIHISDLEIFDKPKELSEFSTIVKPYKPTYRLTKAPQSWQYIDIEKSTHK